MLLNRRFRAIRPGQPRLGSWSGAFWKTHSRRGSGYELFANAAELQYTRTLLLLLGR